MVMLRLKRLTRPKAHHRTLSASVRDEVASMARADAIETYLRRKNNAPRAVTFGATEPGA